MKIKLRRQEKTQPADRFSEIIKYVFFLKSFTFEFHRFFMNIRYRC